MNTNFQNWRKEEVNGKLVIDGYSLLFSLCTCDWSHGGQYPEFRNKVQRFFLALKSSKIDSIVVIDGVDVEGEKTAIIKRRRKESIQMVEKYCRLERKDFASGSGVLPSQSLKVFIMTLQDMGVELIFADGEGDITVYEIANAYNCPVLSNDSDFFMYNLTSGYIPFNRFEWNGPLPITGEVFYHKSFCSEFRMNDSDLRLIIPAVAGNDFIIAMNNLQLADYMYEFCPEDYTRRKKIGIEVIVNFIRTFSSLQNFKDSINSFPDLSQNAKDTIKKNCVHAEEMYNSERVSTLETLREATSLHIHHSIAMPGWILSQFRSGNFFPIHSLTIGKALLDNFIDDTSKPSSTLASKPIRQFIYGLTGWQEVREIYREGLDLVERDITATTELEGHQLPLLQKIPSMSLSERAHLFYSIVGCSDSEPVSRLDKTWHLVIAATRFWVRMCSPLQHEVEVLVLCFVILHSDSKPRMQRSTEHDRFRRSDQWMELLHIFSQWQSCYGDIFNLNQVLMFPLKPISPAQLFDGRLLMFMVRQRCDERLVSQVLDRREHIRLYEQLVDAVLWPHGQSSRDCRQAASGSSHFLEGRNISSHSVSALDWRKDSLPLSQTTDSTRSVLGRRYLPQQGRDWDCSTEATGQLDSRSRYQHDTRCGESKGYGKTRTHTSELRYSDDRGHYEERGQRSGRQKEEGGDYGSRRQHEDGGESRQWINYGGGEDMRRSEGGGCYSGRGRGGERNYSYSHGRFEDRREYGGKQDYGYSRRPEGGEGFRGKRSCYSQGRYSTGSYDTRRYEHSRWHGGSSQNSPDDLDWRA